MLSGLRSILAQSSLDNRLIGVLKLGQVRLLSVQWLLSRPTEWTWERLQDLEAREAGGAEAPFLSSEDAASALQAGGRQIGVISHGWLQRGAHPPSHRSLGAEPPRSLAVPHPHPPRVQGILIPTARAYELCGHT